MKNLAGVTEADESIQEELYLAGIYMVNIKPDPCEFPHSIAGEIGNWTLSRAWRYWVASAADGDGLPLDVATELHERNYPIIGPGQPETYGQVIRVAGHGGCPPPSEWVKHYDAQGLELIVDPDGKQESEWKSMIERYSALRQSFDKYRFVSSLDETVKSVVDSYHIDTQIGLNEFARVVREIL